MFYLTVVSDAKNLYVRNTDGSYTEKVELNNSEYNLFRFLSLNYNEIFNRETLLQQGWPGRVVSENSLNVAMMKLRKKVELLQVNIQIKTVPSIGYQLYVKDDVKIEHTETLSQPLIIDESDTTSANPDKKNEEIYDSNQWQITQDILVDTLNQRIVKIRSKMILNFKRYFNIHPLIQFFLMLILCLFVFYYLYSECWSVFMCTIETVCGDYVK